MQNTFKRGEIWWLKPKTPQSGHIQSGERPVIIISSDEIPMDYPIVRVVPCTRRVRNLNTPAHVMFVIDGKISIALVEQSRPVNIDELQNYKGKIDKYLLDQIDMALLIVNGLAHVPMEEQIKKGTHLQEGPENLVTAPLSGKQVEKFYSRFPRLAENTATSSVEESSKGIEKVKNIWTKEEKIIFLADVKRLPKEEVIKKYNISDATYRTYPSKFKRILEEEKLRESSKIKTIVRDCRRASKERSIS